VYQIGWGARGYDGCLRRERVCPVF
jgi:hypothetical protein